jgi:5-deoxy-glucuronate isomerase
MLQGDLPGDLFRKLLGSNVQTGRLIAGATRSLLGNWTNWPPHEHAAMLEEIYVYVDSRYRLFGLQLVYMDEISPAEIEVVREGGAVLLPAGYHPDVSIPGSTLNFVWSWRQTAKWSIASGSCAGEPSLWLNCYL